MKHTGALLALCLASSAACKPGSATTDSADSSLHTLVLPDLPTELPAGEARGLVVGSCATCHSTRYLLDQPVLTRKAWTATVDKMVKSYGAPVEEQNKRPIVDYLVATHGREE